MLYFLQMYGDNNGRTTGWFLPISRLKKPLGRKNLFSNFWFQEMSLKKGDFCQFLASKNYDKIWHCFNIICNFCISENFDMSPVSMSCQSQSLHYYQKCGSSILCQSWSCALLLKMQLQHVMSELELCILIKNTALVSTARARVVHYYMIKTSAMVLYTSAAF